MAGVRQPQPFLSLSGAIHVVPKETLEMFSDGKFRPGWPCLQSTDMLLRIIFYSPQQQLQAITAPFSSPRPFLSLTHT